MTSTQIPSLEIYGEDMMPARNKDTVFCAAYIEISSKITSVSVSLFVGYAVQFYHIHVSKRKQVS